MSEHIYEDSTLEHERYHVIPFEWQREEIVRCRDCKHVGYIPDFQPDRRFKPRDYWWCEAEWCEGLEGDNPTVEPDGYCWHGERRDS